MEQDYLTELLSGNPLLLLVAAAAFVIAVIAMFSGAAARRRIAEQSDAIKLRVDSLWAEMDDVRVAQFNGPTVSGSHDPTASERFSAEKTAYDNLWPLVWLLHDKLGQFLRAVEAEESAGELRLEARNAALKARTTLNRVRPFCHLDVDELVTQLIDIHIKAHLAACHYLDARKDPQFSDSNHEQAVQKEKFRVLYDGQAKELLGQLVTTIRSRMLR